MNKIGAVIVTVVIVIFAYLLILVAMPILTEAVSTSNTTMASTSNMTMYPGTQEAVLSTPWVIFFLPAVIGTIVVISILRKP